MVAAGRGCWAAGVSRHQRELLDLGPQPDTRSQERGGGVSDTEGPLATQRCSPGRAPVGTQDLKPWKEGRPHP